MTMRDGDGRRHGQGILGAGEHPLHVSLHDPGGGARAQDGHVEPLQRGRVQAGETRQSPLRCCHGRPGGVVAAEEQVPADGVLVRLP
jgi:hypothetical protein